MIGISDQPDPTGMAIWRVCHAPPRERRALRPDLRRLLLHRRLLPHQPEHHVHLPRGGQPRPRRHRPDLLRGGDAPAAAGYGGVWREIAASVTDSAKVNYAWFHRLLVEGAWHRGRVAPIGDAAHACPPPSPRARPSRWRTPPCWPKCSLASRTGAPWTPALGEFTGWADAERIVLNLHRAYADHTGRDLDVTAAFGDAIAWLGHPMHISV